MNKECPDCNGQGWWPDYNHQVPEQVECERCKGTGTLAGEFPAGYSRDDEAEDGGCPVCGGRGEVIR